MTREMEQKNYAVIRTGGKQYRVSEGSKILVERLEGEKGAKVTFGEVLLVGSGEAVKVGSPLLSGASVAGKILAQSKGPKLVAFKKKRRKGFTNKKGHRQQLTEVAIESISA